MSTAVQERLASLRARMHQTESLFRDLAEDEAARRLDRLVPWLEQANAYNHDGVILTPLIADYLSGPGDFEARLAEMDRLRAETRSGRFRIDNGLQKDLEFRRFLTEYQPTFGREKSFEELYGLFAELEELGEPEQEVFLSDQRILEAKRAGYEAALFLEFLEDFRKSTSRPIVVIPNNKAQLSGGGYGRQWVIEPIEERLRDGYTVRYNGVTSHATMRLNVPAAFPKEFVGQLCDEMPHIVIVDGGRVPRDSDMLRLSRASCGYANWFAVFNDLRAEGDVSRYENDGLFYPEHYPDVMKWHEYVIVREQMQEWVTPGSTYRLGLWGPEPTKQAILGETKIDWPDMELRGDTPTAILTNTIIYRSNTPLAGHRFAVPDEEISSVLSGTAPFSINELDIEVKDRLMRKSNAKLKHWGVSGTTPRSRSSALGATGSRFSWLGRAWSGTSPRCSGESERRWADCLGIPDRQGGGRYSAARRRNGRGPAAEGSRVAATPGHGGEGGGRPGFDCLWHPLQGHDPRDRGRETGPRPGRCRRAGIAAYLQRPQPRRRRALLRSAVRRSRDRDTRLSHPPPALRHDPRGDT